VQQALVRMFVAILLRELREEAAAELVAREDA
jgi:hypothetical protein